MPRVWRESWTRAPTAGKDPQPDQTIARCRALLGIPGYYGALFLTGAPRSFATPTALRHAQEFYTQGRQAGRFPGRAAVRVRLRDQAPDGAAPRLTVPQLVLLQASEIV